MTNGAYFHPDNAQEEQGESYNPNEPITCTGCGKMSTRGQIWPYPGDRWEIWSCADCTPHGSYRHQRFLPVSAGKMVAPGSRFTLTQSIYEGKWGE